MTEGLQTLTAFAVSVGDGVERKKGRRPWLSAFFLLLAFAVTGCNRSDPIVLIQLHPKNPDIIYVATNDYIYKSRDRGETWTNLSKGMSHSRVIAMAVDPAYPRNNFV